MNDSNLIAIVGLVIGIPNLLWAIHLHRRYYESKNWSKTTGTITSAQINWNRAAGSSVPHVTYEYEVKGTSYEGSRIWLSMSSSPSTARNQGILDRFPVGSKTSVFYNPIKPNDAILEVRFSIGIIGCYLAAFIGITFAVISILSIKST